MLIRQFATGPDARRRMQGVTLIEVLVAATILAVGLLGLAALLGSAMQSNQHASARTQAVMLSSDMLDRIRANQVDAEDYVSIQGDRACDLEWSYDDDLSVAENDLDEWYSHIACYLPAGRGRIQLDDQRVTVSVTWTDIASENEDDFQNEETITLVTDL